MKRSRSFWMLALLLGLWCPLLSVAWAWDGDWTQAKSGQGDIFDDPDNSQGKAGTDPPQKFLTPNPRDYADVDPEELNDYFHRRNKEYTPYALARITQELRYNDLIIPKGYYLVKPGDVNDGSPRINLKTINASATANQTGSAAAGEQLPPLSPPGATAPATWNQSIGPSGQTMPSPPAQPNPQVNPKASVYEVFVLIRQGKVMGVVPINRMETYKPPRDQKVPRQALAWVEMEDRHPVLKFYYKKRLYCTDFQ